MQFNIITEPESAVSANSLYALAYSGLYIHNSGQFYLPPIPQSALIEMMDANSYYASCVQFDVQMLLAYFLDNPILSRQDFGDVATEYNLTGNGYIFLDKNPAGFVLNAKQQRSAFTVCLTDKTVPFGVSPKIKRYAELINGIPAPFNEGDIFHFKNNDPLQPIYGKPVGMACLQSALLGEQCVLSPRKALLNGTSGKIIATAGLNPDEKKELGDNLVETKNQAGQTIHVNAENMDNAEKLMKIFFNDVMFKVEYDRFSNMAAEAIYVMWGIPPVLLGQTAPQGTSYPDLNKMYELYYKTQVVPNQQRFSVINKYLPKNNNLYFFKPSFDDDFMVTQIIEKSPFNKFQGITIQRPDQKFEIEGDIKKFRHGQVVFFDGENVSFKRAVPQVGV